VKGATALVLVACAFVATTAWTVLELRRGPRVDDPPPAPTTPAPPRTPTAPPLDDPDAVALLRDVHARILDRPFYAVGRLTTHRGGVDRELLLRLYYKRRGVSIARVEGPPREDGTMVLRRDGRVVVFLPKADLVLDLPPSLGGDRLFGSDFAADDLLALGGGVERFAATFGADETIDGVPCRRINLRPRTPASSLHALVSLWIARGGGTPVRIAYVGDDGRVSRVVEMKNGSENAPPVAWKARTLAPRPGESELVFQFFERDPPVPEDFFTVEGMRRWR